MNKVKGAVTEAERNCPRRVFLEDPRHAGTVHPGHSLLSQRPLRTEKPGQGPVNKAGPVLGDLTAQEDRQVDNGNAAGSNQVEVNPR